MNCPIDMPGGLCNLCHYSKEGLCDHPYSINMKVSEIKKVTSGGKDDTR